MPSRRPSVEMIAAQLRRHDRPRFPDADDELTFAHVLMESDPSAQANALYLFVFDRPADEQSEAAEALRGGMHPALLGMDLLTSSEGQRLDAERRYRVGRTLLPCLVRHRWGIPDEVSSASLLVDTDAAFVVSAYRVALGVPPTRTQYIDAVRLVAEGHGREHLLRLLWMDPRARRRLFGPRRTRLGATSLMFRRRSLDMFRWHVLAEEASTRSVLTWLVEWELHGDEVNSPVVDEPSAELAELLARVAEVASGLRQLAGHTEW